MFPLQVLTYYMSLLYRNKSKSQLTSPTPAQLPAVALSAGHIVCLILLGLLIFIPFQNNYFKPRAPSFLYNHNDHGQIFYFYPRARRALRVYFLLCCC
jgi:hypothetical protein